MSRRVGPLVALAATALLASACQGGDGDVVEIELFQFKPEAIATFDQIIADFEAENPGIRVVHNHVPDSETAIRTRMVRGDVPDVMTLNGNATFGELAEAGVFHDFADEPVLEGINPAYLEIVQDLGASEDGAVNGIPFAANASGVLYNADLFAEHDVEVPTTWDELIAAAQTFADAGVQPVYATLADSWTAMPTFNALAAVLPPEDVFDQLREEQTTFAESFDVVAERMLELFAFAQDDRFSRSYEDGNRAFAEGDVAMYLQGSFAIPAIADAEPDFEIGTFAMPVDDPDDARLLSGVDVTLTMGADPEHPEESLAFIEHIMTAERVQAYADEQRAIPTLEDTTSDLPELEGVMPFVEEGRLVGYPEHQIPPAIPLPALTQQFLIDGDVDAYLAELDEEWDKLQRRRS